MRQYERLTIEVFGAHLLRTGDLDPVYLALNRSGFEQAQRLRWLSAYAAFYHSGVACWLSEQAGPAFWEAMAAVAANAECPVGGLWPRGHERRHFRGAAAGAGVADWAAKHPVAPEEMFITIAGRGGPFQAVADRARSYVSIGVWLAFKCVDLVDACMGIEVDQTDVEPFLYETPRTSLLNVWMQKAGHPPADEATAVLEMVARLRVAFEEFQIPHKPGHPVDMFTIETIACKHKSHLSGHYPLWNDIRDISKGLQRWMPICPSARAFHQAMPTYESSLTLW